MSVVPTPITISRYRTFAADWAPCSGTDEISGHEMIPPGDDAIMIRFMFYKDTMYTFAPDGAVQEYWMIPHSPTKAIMVRPSEFNNQDATSILQSPSGRMMIDFINTHFPSKDKPLLVPKLVATLVELVQSSIGSETEGFIDVRKCETVEILLHLNDDEATRPCMQGYFEATRCGTCAICLEDYEIGHDDGVRLPCVHGFHGSCIYEWLMINSRCPVCCDTFSETELIPWFNAPLQDGIWLSHSSVGSVASRETSKKLSVPTHSSVGSVDNREISYFSFQRIPMLIQCMIQKFLKNFQFR
ncbi:hypothetical protein ACLB2K_069537 [Fragaria x ananassa]